MLAGSTTALVLASLAGSALGFLNKAAVPQAGTGTSTSSSSRRTATPTSTRCTYSEQLSAGKVPYYRPPGRVPGAHRRGDAGRGLGRAARSRDPDIRGREFYDVTVRAC